MTDRHALSRAFLRAAGWGAADRRDLAGDASNRSYDRLSDADGRRAVLMDADPARGEDVRPFVRIASFLRGAGLSAPEILAEDDKNGFLLLEDLGDDLFARAIPARPQLEREMYEAATDVLVALHRLTPPDVPDYGPGRMTDLAALAFDKYRAGITGDPGLAARAGFNTRFRPLLDDATRGIAPVLVLRDYHAENLLWLPDRDGVARVGLLDFQDAMTGHPGYDLVSLLQDARRDVPPPLEAAMIARYLDATGPDRDRFEAAYAVLGAQRNLRILGVFARLGMEHGKPHYVDLIPRVWGLLQRDLDHPALAPVAALLRDSLPEPDPGALERLKR
jgi:aminoglycoside/choline kinase family phosphotransferase